MRISRHIPFLLIAAFLMVPGSTAAQSISIGVDDTGSLSATTIQILILLSVISLAPGIIIMVTCFPFLITVFAILRQGIGLQQSPPNMLLVSLALFLTYFVMEPVFLASWEAGIGPYVDGVMEPLPAFEAASVPFREFVVGRLDPDTLQAIMSLREDVDTALDTRDLPLSVLLPSFMLSEISHAFQVGFLIFLPFLIIDLVVAAILMSMGMMMVPPAIVSLPFKLAFFVVSDGWALLATSLVESYLN